MRSEARYGGATPPRRAELSTPEKPMRIYAKDRVCPFRYTAAAWGAFSNFQPLGVPIAAGPWTFFTSEAVYQAAKFGTRPDVQQRIAEAPTAREAAAIGRTPGSRHRSRLERPARRRHALGAAPETRGQRGRDRRGAGRDRRPAHRRGVARDPWWGARPVADRYEGRNVLGRLWMELRQQLRDGEPGARSGAWLGRIRVGRLASGPVVPRAARAAV